MELFVYSRAHIERVEPHHEAPHLIISITTTVDDVARLPVVASTLAVVRLSFFDLDEQRPGVLPDELFQRAHARMIWDAIVAHRAQLQRVIVHCDAGYSRSPAVAAAIARVFNGDDQEFFRRYQPNRRVYRLLLEEAVDRGLL